ncbi:MAG: addiction module protein [Bifidobacteriaceae bacterium]|nr:addiction module protein [Bifidobacteriaceae bacterium]
MESGLLSLDEEGIHPDRIDTAWREDLRRRIDEIETGAVQLVGGEESEARVRTLLADLSQ